MSVDRPPSIQIRENVWQRTAEARISGERVQELHRIRGCTFEAEGTVVEFAPAQGDGAGS